MEFLIEDYTIFKIGNFQLPSCMSETRTLMMESFGYIYTPFIVSECIVQFFQLLKTKSQGISYSGMMDVLRLLA